MPVNENSLCLRRHSGGNRLRAFGSRRSARPVSVAPGLEDSPIGYLLLERLRSVGLAGTALGRATVGSIRLRLLKIAAHVSVSARRVHIRLASACPFKELFTLCHQRLMALCAGSG